MPYLNRFPLVGALPYVGFFRQADARRERARLERLGLDTYVRPVAGYSTLGITADPFYSSMLEGSDARIVEITLHEMVHGTVFPPGHAEWHESFATFVGPAWGGRLLPRDRGVGVRPCGKSSARPSSATGPRGASLSSSSRWCASSRRSTRVPSHGRRSCGCGSRSSPGPAPSTCASSRPARAAGPAASRSSRSTTRWWSPSPSITAPRPSTSACSSARAAASRPWCDSIVTPPAAATRSGISGSCSRPSHALE